LLDDSLYIDYALSIGQKRDRKNQKMAEFPAWGLEILPEGETHGKMHHPGGRLLASVSIEAERLYPLYGRQRSKRKRVNGITFLVRQQGFKPGQDGFL
jgi:hypothetical protein